MKERLNEASSFLARILSSCTFSIVLIQQGRLSLLTFTLLATARSDCIRSTVVLSGGGGCNHALGESSGCRSTDSPQAPRTSAAHLSQVVVILCCNCLFAWWAPSLLDYELPRARTHMVSVSLQHPAQGLSTRGAQ